VYDFYRMDPLEVASGSRRATVAFGADEEAPADCLGELICDRVDGLGVPRGAGQ
jgi:hypothetical protein